MFSTFPGGYPGFGLLILRLALAVTTLFQGAVYLSETNGAVSLNWIGGIFAIALGIFLLVGFLTPVVIAIVLTGGVIIIVSSFKTGQNISLISDIYALVLAAAIAFLGPGAYSLDARLFGRREIIIPKTAPAPDK